MATMNIQGAIKELVDQVATVPGINHAPDEPAEQVTSWPVAMVYTTDGLSRNEPANIIKDLHNVQIAVLMPLNDYRQAALTMLPLFEPIIDKIITHRNGRTSSHYQTFADIQYTLGPVEWAQGQTMYGYVFTLLDLKITNAT